MTGEGEGRGGLRRTVGGHSWIIATKACQYFRGLYFQRATAALHPSRAGVVLTSCVMFL